jgi:hypothetical protein
MKCSTVDMRTMVLLSRHEWRNPRLRNSGFKSLGDYRYGCLLSPNLDGMNQHLVCLSTERKIVRFYLTKSEGSAEPLDQKQRTQISSSSLVHSTRWMSQWSDTSSHGTEEGETKHSHREALCLRQSCNDYLRTEKCYHTDLIWRHE